MATQRQRAWFTDFPQTEDQPGFAKHNHPTQATFEDLFASVPFILNFEDKATTSKQGLAMVATDASAYALTSKTNTNDGVDFVRPHQVPDITLAANEDEDSPPAAPPVVLDTTTYALGIGILKTKPSRTGGTGTSYAIRLGVDYTYFDFDDNGKLTLIPIGNQSADARYFFSIMDGTAGWVTASTLLGDGYWTESNGVLSTTDDYAVDIGGNEFLCGGIVLLDTTTLSVAAETKKTPGNGASMTVHGQTGMGAGATGGHIYVYGGSGAGGGVSGNTILCHSGYGVVGLSAIGGTAETGYMLKVHGNVKITGTLAIGTGGGGAITTILAVDDTGAVQDYSFADVRASVLPTGAEGKFLFFTTEWVAQTLTGNVIVNGSGETTLANSVITDDHVNVDAMIAIAKLHADQNGRVILSDPDNGSLYSSTVTANDVELLAGAAAAGLTNADFLSVKSLATSGLKPKMRTIAAATTDDAITAEDQVINLKINNASGTNLDLCTNAVATKQYVRVNIVENGGGKNLTIVAFGTEAIRYLATEQAGHEIAAPQPGSFVDLYWSENGVVDMVAYIIPAP